MPTTPSIEKNFDYYNKQPIPVIIWVPIEKEPSQIFVYRRHDHLWEMPTDRDRENILSPVQ